jgi:hypothetical protein
MPRVNGQPTEAEEQAALFQWAKLSEGSKPQLRLLYAIPNGGSRHRLEAANLKRQGLKAGVPDICLAYPSGVYHGLYIELKVGKNKPSDKQKEWLASLRAAGYMTAVCYGFQEAKDMIEKYLKL